MSVLLGNVGAPQATLLGGKSLLRWIESGGPVPRSSRMHRYRMKWSAHWFERHLRMTESRCVGLDLPTQLVFIVGLWRSGTTLLHNALIDATQWTTPLTWQCYRPADFILAPPRATRTVTRPMDEGRIGTFSPQEDEFAALLLGENSTYRAFIDPRRLPELTDLLRRWADATDTPPPLSEHWELFLKAVANGNQRPMILKSPNHTFRVPWLATRFPEAKFIWISREKTDVMNSNLRMWKMMIDRYSLWQSDVTLLQEFLENAVAIHDDVYDWAKTFIPNRMHFASFDRVINDRRLLVAELLGELDIEEALR